MSHVIFLNSNTPFADPVVLYFVYCVGYMIEIVTGSSDFSSTNATSPFFTSTRFSEDGGEGAVTSAALNVTGSPGSHNEIRPAMIRNSASLRTKQATDQSPFPGCP